MPCKSVVMVTEMFNFYDESKQSEFKDEVSFNEHLVKLSGHYLEMVTSCLTKYGGDLIKFMGYSAVAIWPGFKDHHLTDVDEPRDLNTMRKSRTARHAPSKSLMKSSDEILFE